MPLLGDSWLWESMVHRGSLHRRKGYRLPLSGKVVEEEENYGLSSRSSSKAVAQPKQAGRGLRHHEVGRLVDFRIKLATPGEIKRSSQREGGLCQQPHQNPNRRARWARPSLGIARDAPFWQPIHPLSSPSGLGWMGEDRTHDVISHSENCHSILLLVVCTPYQYLRCILRTDMPLLAAGWAGRAADQGHQLRFGLYTCCHSSSYIFNVNCGRFFFFERAIPLSVSA
ncbi:hypothetical protein VTO42DRAFT_5153 [Malbranchea cinnamomea]